MEKEKLSISAVADLLGTKAYLLRFFEKEFSLQIPRTPSNRRYYTTKEINQLRYIYKLKNDGIKNKDIKAVLASSRVELDVYAPNDTQSPSCSMELGELLDEKESGLKQVALAIAGLKKDMDELKKSFQMPNKAPIEDEAMRRLLEENEGLKQRLKAKTYELVDLKERMKNTKRSRRLFS